MNELNDKKLLPIAIVPEDLAYFFLKNSPNHVNVGDNGSNLLIVALFYYFTINSSCFPQGAAAVAVGKMTIRSTTFEFTQEIRDKVINFKEQVAVLPTPDQTLLCFAVRNQLDNMVIEIVTKRKYPFSVFTDEKVFPFEPLLKEDEQKAISTFNYCLKFFPILEKKIASLNLSTYFKESEVAAKYIHKVLWLAAKHNKTAFIANVFAQKKIIEFCLEYQQYQEPHSGDTAMHYAVKHGNLEMVNYLIKIGIDINQANNSEFLPVELALLKDDNFEFAKKLIEISFPGEEVDKTLENILLGSKNFPQIAIKNIGLLKNDTESKFSDHFSYTCHTMLTKRADGDEQQQAYFSIGEYLFSLNEYPSALSFLLLVDVTGPLTKHIKFSCYRNIFLYSDTQEAENKENPTRIDGAKLEIKKTLKDYVWPNKNQLSEKEQLEAEIKFFKKLFDEGIIQNFKVAAGEQVPASLGKNLDELKTLFSQLYQHYYLNALAYIKNGETEKLKELLASKNGLGLNIFNFFIARKEHPLNKTSLIYLLAESSNIEIISLLANYKLDFNSTNETSPPQQSDAVEDFELNIVQELAVFLQKNTVDIDQYVLAVLNYAVLIAAKHNNVDLIKQIIAIKSLNSLDWKGYTFQGDTALHFAVRHKNLAMVELLMEMATALSIFQTNNHNKSAFDLALKNNAWDMLLCFTTTIIERSNAPLLNYWLSPDAFSNVFSKMVMDNNSYTIKTRQLIIKKLINAGYIFPKCKNQVLLTKGNSSVLQRFTFDLLNHENLALLDFDEGEDSPLFKMLSCVDIHWWLGDIGRKLLNYALTAPKRHRLIIEYYKQHIDKFYDHVIETFSLSDMRYITVENTLTTLKVNEWYDRLLLWNVVVSFGSYRSSPEYFSEKLNGYYFLAFNGPPQAALSPKKDVSLEEYLNTPVKSPEQQIVGALNLYAKLITPRFSRVLREISTEWWGGGFFLEKMEKEKKQFSQYFESITNNIVALIKENTPESNGLFKRIFDSLDVSSKICILQSGFCYFNVDLDIFTYAAQVNNIELIEYFISLNLIPNNNQPYNIATKNGYKEVQQKVASSGPQQWKAQETLQKLSIEQSLEIAVNKKEWLLAKTLASKLEAHSIMGGYDPKHLLNIIEANQQNEITVALLHTLCLKMRNSSNHPFYTQLYHDCIYLACRQDHFSNAKVLLTYTEKDLASQLKINTELFFYLVANTSILTTSDLTEKTRAALNSFVPEALSSCLMELKNCQSAFDSTKKNTFLYAAQVLYQQQRYAEALPFILVAEQNPTLKMQIYAKLMGDEVVPDGITTLADYLHTKLKQNQSTAAEESSQWLTGYNNFYDLLKQNDTLALLKNLATYFPSIATDLETIKTFAFNLSRWQAKAIFDAVKNNRGDEVNKFLALDDENALMVKNILLDPVLGVDKTGNTLLHIAVTSGNVEGIKFCLKNQQLLWTKNNQGKIPLQMAIENQQLEMALELITVMEWDLNNDETAARWKETLFIASIHGQASIIEKLFIYNPLFLKQHINARNNEGNTALHLAVENKHYQVVAQLLKAGAKINLQNLLEAEEKKNLNDTPLHIAIRSGDDKMVTTLLEAPTSANLKQAFLLKNNEGLTPLAQAIVLDAKNEKNAPSSIVKILCEQSQKEKYNTQEEVALLAIKHNHSSLLESSLAAEGSIKKYTDAQGNTLLHEAVKAQNAALVKKLVTSGIRIDRANHAQETPLFCALKSKDEKTTKTLLDQYQLLSLNTTKCSGLWQTADMYQPAKKILSGNCLKEIRNYCIKHKWKVIGAGEVHYYEPGTSIKVPHHVKLILEIIDNSTGSSIDKLTRIKAILDGIHSSRLNLNLWRSIDTKKQYQFIYDRLAEWGVAATVDAPKSYGENSV